MTNDIIELGKARYDRVSGYDDMDKDDGGYVSLKPTADRVDSKIESLTTNIDGLEAKLKEFRAEKAKTEKYTKTEEYKESKKRPGKKKKEKAKASLLNMVFNNADADNAEEDEDDSGSYKDNKKRAPRKPKEPTNTLDTTYGKRFSAPVSLLFDTINDFDDIANEIQAELDSTKGATKGMYRSSQMGNLISAKSQKRMAVSELASIAKTVSDLEYKKAKDSDAADVNSNKAISSLGAKFLRGSFGDDDYGSDKPTKGKKGKKKKGGWDVDDDDDEWGTITKDKTSSNDTALAEEFAKSIIMNKENISFTSHERNAKLDGKYKTMIVCDPMKPDKDYKFIAVDIKTDREIPDFKDDYPDILPKKRNVKLIFDIQKGKAYDKNTGRNYKLIYK